MSEQSLSGPARGFEKVFWCVAIAAVVLQLGYSLATSLAGDAADFRLWHALLPVVIVVAGVGRLTGRIRRGYMGGNGGP